MESQNESDEDVILPNSPLYQYFDLPSEGIPLTENRPATFCSLIKDRICAEVREIAEVFVSYVDDFSNFFKSEHHKVQRKLFFNVFQFASSKKLLVPEDAAFLQSCMSESGVSGNAPKVFLSKLGIAIVLSFIFLLVSIFGLRLETYMTLIECAVLRQIVRKISIFIAAFNVSCYCYWFFLLAYHIYRCSVVFSKAKKLCMDTSILIDILKKTYKIVQEFELIARGFTSASVAGIAQRLEVATGLPISYPNRQLPELRKVLFIWMHDIFLSYRSATCYLINMSPIPTEGASQYFATMPLKEFGGLLKYNPKCEAEFQELLKVSDDLCLSCLKAMHLLVTVQVSEFLKRFSLCFFHDSNMSEINYFDTFEKLNKYVHLLEQTTKCDSKILFAAKQSYILYRNMDNYNRQHDPIPPHFKSPLHDLTIAVRDMNFRLKAALIKTNAIEDDLVKESEKLEKKAKVSLPPQSVEKLLSCFKEMESELTAVKECMSTCMDNLLLKKENVAPEQTRIDKPNCSEDEKELIASPVFIFDADRVIEDEVLEAVAQSTSDSIDNSHLSGARSDDIVIDRKITKNLMQELKKILVVKAEETRCREEKAIRARMAKNKNLPESAELKQELNKSDCSSSDQENIAYENETDSELCNVKAVEKEHDHNEVSSENVLRMRFLPPGDKSFAESIAAMASQRQQLLNLCNDTYEFEEDGSKD